MTNGSRKRLSCGLSLIFLLAFVHVHFLGDPCLLHSEHTAQALESTLSFRVMHCLCFFHAVYAPIEAAFSAVPSNFVEVEEPNSVRPIRLLTLEIFHPPRG